jgi:hypothetical protein
MQKEVKGVEVFVRLVQVLLATYSRKSLVDAYDKLTTEEKKQLFIYTECKTPNEIIKRIRNHAENLAK